MATEAKPTLRRRKRPVEFRGLSTHYVAGDRISVSFRYPAQSFQPQPDHQIYLNIGGSRSGILASARVGDPSKHRLCDGGLYRTGSVSIATSATTILSASCVLLYSNASGDRVFGKSEKFTICPQKDFPSIQIRSGEDDVYIEKLRAHSPVDNPATFPPAVGAGIGLADDVSFALLSNSSSLLGGWEVLEDRHEREEEEGDESDCWSDVAERVKSISSRSEESSTDSEEEAVCSHTPPQQTIMKSFEHNVPAREQNLSIESATPAADEHEVSLSESPPQLVSLSDLSGNTAMLKNANKELRTKVRVLHDKVQSVSEERDNLQEVVEIVNGQVSVLKQKNKKLTEQHTALKTKYRQVRSENTVLSQHCEKQVAQIEQYEKHLKTASTENQQLQRKLRHAVKKSKHQHQPGQVSTEASSRKKKCPSTQIEGISQERPIIDVYVRDSKQGNPLILFVSS